MSDWRSWLKHWKPVMLEQSHHEYEFARRVLTNVAGLAPSEVTPQREFTDEMGSARRMDFAIERDCCRIAIEVDGFDKTGEGRGMNSDEHADYTMRERSLVALGWTVLRFANREMYEDSGKLALQIRARLQDAERESAARSNQGSESPAPHQEITVGAAAPSSAADPPSGEASKWRAGAAIAASVLIVACVILVTVIIMSSGDNGSTGVDPVSVDDCPASHPIKGNVSQSGEQIYHRPGDDFYARTNPERCFNSASAAESAGFRPARR